MNFKIFLVAIFSFSCGVKSKPVVPRDPSLDLYIQEKLKSKEESAKEKKDESSKKSEEAKS